jgi:hypothetical protein
MIGKVSQVQADQDSTRSCRNALQGIAEENDSKAECRVVLKHPALPN